MSRAMPCITTSVRAAVTDAAAVAERVTAVAEEETAAGRLNMVSEKDKSRRFGRRDLSRLYGAPYLSHVARFHRYSSGPCLCVRIQRRQKASCATKITTPMAKLCVVVACSPRPQW